MIVTKVDRVDGQWFWEIDGNGHYMPGNSLGELREIYESIGAALKNAEFVERGAK